MLSIAVITGIVIGGIGAVLALSPTLSLAGSGTVTVGGMVSIHGSGFIPGSSVTLTRDNRVVLSFTGRSATTGEPIYGIAAQVAMALQMAGNILPMHSSVTNTTIKVSSLGTFDAMVAVDSSWSAGPHSIRATEGLSSRSAELKVTVMAKPAALVVHPSTLDLGQVQVGRTVIVSELVSNAGGYRLSWTADTQGTKWLKVDTLAGTIEPGSLPQPMYVTVDTTHLTVGDYTAMLRISSNGGEGLVGVKLKVIPQGRKLQAKLAAGPSNVSFGTLTVGQEAVTEVTVSNVGEQNLNWQASAGNTNWLTLGNSSGTIKPGGRPQTVYITANTSQLTPGYYSAALQISSNGGNAQVNTTLTAAVPQPIPTPPTHVVSPKLRVNPTTFNANTDCSYAQGQGWYCMAILSSDSGASDNLKWSASSSPNGIAFYPANGILFPGQTALVNILIPEITCPASATFNFTGPNNIATASWSCTTPPVELLVSPPNLNANTDCTTDDSGNWICMATLGTLYAQSGLNWSASSSLTGVTFSPANGTLPPQQGEPVKIVIPKGDCNGNSGSFTFTGPTNPATIVWSCSPNPPKFTVSPTNFSPSNCPQSGNGYLCTLVFTETPDSQGSLYWHASNDDGITFNPPSGTLSQGHPLPVTFFADCQTYSSYSFTFIGPANTANASWNCSQILGVSPTSLDTGNCTFMTNTWECAVTLQESADSQGTINWSASSNLSSAQFSPPGGQLSPGQSVTVMMTVDCENGTLFGNTDTIANRYINAITDRYVDSIADRYIDSYCIANRYIDSIADRYINACVDGYAYCNTDRYANRHTDRYTYDATNRHSYANRHTDTNHATDKYTDSYTNGYADATTCADRYTDSNSNGYADAFTLVGSHFCGRDEMCCYC